MAKFVKNKKAVSESVDAVEESVISPEIAAILGDQGTEETIAEEEVETVVTNMNALIADLSEVVPGPEVKMELPPTLAEEAVTIEQGDDVRIVGIRGFDGISGKVQEVRPDGYIVIKSATGTFAAPKHGVQKVK